MLTRVRSTEDGWTDNEIRYHGLAMRGSKVDSPSFTYYDWDSIKVMQEKDGGGTVADRQVHPSTALGAGGYAPIVSVGLLDELGTSDIAHVNKSG